MTRRRYASFDWWKVVLKGRARFYLNAWKPFTPYVFDKILEGEVFSFYVANKVGHEWYGPGSDLNNLEMRYVRSMVCADMTVLEIGAHHGCDTVLLAEWVGDGGFVVAVEPLPENVAVIHANVGLNDLTKRVEVMPYAVGAEEGVVTMKEGSSNGSVRPHGGKGVNVDVISVDDLCYGRDRFDVDLIKIDVEGYEYEVLKGAQKVLAEQRPALQIEVHCDSLPKFGEDPEDLWKYVNIFNYDVMIQLNDLVDPVPYTGQPMAGRIHIFCTPKARP